MEHVRLGNRRVAGFDVGVGGLFDIFGGGSGTSPNPAYQATATITGQKVDPNAPPDAPAGPTVQDACANIPTWAQAIAGCSNANVKPAPGQSVATAPASPLTLFFGGGVDANGNPIQTPLQWLEAHKTAIAIGGAVFAGIVVYGAIRR